MQLGGHCRKLELQCAQETTQQDENVGHTTMGHTLMHHPESEDTIASKFSKTSVHVLWGVSLADIQQYTDDK